MNLLQRCRQEYFNVILDYIKAVNNAGLENIINCHEKMITSFQFVRYIIHDETLSQELIHSWSNSGADFISTSTTSGQNYAEREVGKTYRSEFCFGNFLDKLANEKN